MEIKWPEEMSPQDYCGLGRGDGWNNFRREGYNQGIKDCKEAFDKAQGSNLVALDRNKLKKLINRMMDDWSSKSSHIGLFTLPIDKVIDAICAKFGQPSPTPGKLETIKFACGCFLIPNVGLSCCKNHEYPCAKIEFFSLFLDVCQCPLNDYQSEHYKKGYIGMCKDCDKPVINGIATKTDAKGPTEQEIYSMVLNVPNNIQVPLGEARKLAKAIRKLIEGKQ